MPKADRPGPGGSTARAWTVVGVGMAIGGLGAAGYFVFLRPEPAPPPPPAAASPSLTTPESLARAVVTKLNAKDLDGVIELTCAQGKSTGRKRLTEAIPQLDPDAPATTRQAPIGFTLRGLKEFPEGYVADITVRYDGSEQEGTMRLQRSGESWTLCGMNAPRIGGVG